MENLDLLLQEKLTNPLRPAYSTFKGYTLPNSFEDYQEEIANLEVRDDDIWVTSYPKSGTTWTQEMVYLIVNDLDYESAKEPLEKRFPHLEQGILLDFKSYKRTHVDFECADYLYDPIPLIKRTEGRRLIKTHLPWVLLPLQIQNQVKKPKIIHVFRNPKDVCVSYFHHSKLLLASSATLEEYLRLFLGGKSPFTPYWENVLGFWNRRYLPNVLFITYEEMKRDLTAIVEKVANFLGEKVPAGEEMLKLTEHLSFSCMKSNPAVSKAELLEAIYKCVGEEKRNDGSFIRSGKVGSHRDELTEEMIGVLDKWTADSLVGTDFKVEY